MSDRIPDKVRILVYQGRKYLSIDDFLIAILKQTKGGAIELNELVRVLELLKNSD